MKVKSAIQLALIAPFSLLLADSLVLSASQVSYHYNKSSSYLNSAASLGETSAIYELYQATGDKSWLAKAAKLGHAEAAWQMYLLSDRTIKSDPSIKSDPAIQSNPSVTYQKRTDWFELALKNNHPGALIQQLEMLVITQNWQLASGQIFKIEQRLNDFPNYNIDENLLDALTQTTELGALNTQIVLPESYKKSIQKLKGRLKQLEKNNNNRFDKTDYSAAFNASCEVKVLVMVNSTHARIKTEQLIAEFHNMLPNSKAKLCFSKVSTNYQLNALCEKSKIGLLSCKSKGIKALVNKSKVGPSINLADDKLRLLVVANEGKANSRGPVIFMDKNDNAQVLLHEVGHWLNLYDEYQLRPTQQAIYCDENQPTKLGENLIVAPLKYSIDTLQTQFNQSLWPVDTCKGTKNQAYKWIPELTPMEYLDVQLTPTMQQFFNEPKLNPFHTDLQTFFE
ncbi:hypothetical protein N9W11_07485 [Psychrosphaera haliotis]|nr:hypothetical protein [Psychrosphaera haliotis]